MKGYFMGFSFLQTEIKDLLVITPHIYEDERGIYKKYYEKNIFEEYGITENFTESSDIFSVKGSLRGLHYQMNYSQAKLLHVINGTIFDVVVDLRMESPTFGKAHTELLKADEDKVVFVPAGFAHGFITLSDTALFNYQCSGRYDPASCGGILWNDNGLNIKWPLKEYGINNVICTEKDSSWPSFEEYCRKIIK